MRVRGELRLMPALFREEQEGRDKAQAIVDPDLDHGHHAFPTDGGEGAQGNEPSIKLRPGQAVSL